MGCATLLNGMTKIKLKLKFLRQLHKESTRELANYWNSFLYYIDFLEKRVLHVSNTHDMFDILDLCEHVEESATMCIIPDIIRRIHRDLEMNLKELHFLLITTINYVLKLNFLEKIFENNQFMWKLFQYINENQNRVEYLCFFMKQCWHGFEDDMRFIAQALSEIPEISPGDEDEKLRICVRSISWKFQEMQASFVENYQKAKEEMIAIEFSINRLIANVHGLH